MVSVYEEWTHFKKPSEMKPLERKEMCQRREKESFRIRVVQMDNLRGLLGIKRMV